METQIFFLRKGGISIWNALLILLVLYLFIMDIVLYFRIQHYPLRREHVNQSEYPATCVEFSPFCYVTVKGLMSDHINEFVNGPLAKILNMVFGISEIDILTPNVISVSHAIVAFFAGRCVSNQVVSVRRMGAALFETGTLLDALDGHVSRSRRHIYGESTEVGSVGYFVDGVCDGIGITFLIVGVFFFLKGKRNYLPLHEKPDLANRKFYQTMICFIAQLVLSSITWNRYIALYQNLLENGDVSQVIKAKQLIVFRSNYFFFLTFLWRILGIHSYLHFLVISIAYDKVWDLLVNVRIIGFVILIVVSFLCELHCFHTEHFLYDGVKALESTTMLT